MEKRGGGGQRTWRVSIDGEDVSFGNCQIVARPVLSPETARQNGDVLSGADVICSQPDDLHYELEPMNDIEDADKIGGEGQTLAASFGGAGGDEVWS